MKCEKCERTIYYMGDVQFKCKCEYVSPDPSIRKAQQIEKQQLHRDTNQEVETQ